MGYFALNLGSRALPGRRPVYAALREMPGDRRTRGRTCQELAELIELPVEVIQPTLRDLVRSDVVMKTGRTRGTRYWMKGNVFEED